jgi:hypothetical protein
VANTKVWTGKNLAPEDLRGRKAAQFAADIILELRNIAKSERLYPLQNILEMAYYEAFAAANHVDIPPDEESRLAEISQDARAAGY